MFTRCATFKTQCNKQAYATGPLLRRVPAALVQGLRPQNPQKQRAKIENED